MHRCEIHHIDTWQCGGPTDLDNLVALCVRHHQLCEPAPPETDHDDGYARAPDQWVIRSRTGGRPEFVPPNRLATADLVTAGRAVETSGTDPPRQLHALTLFDDSTTRLLPCR